MLLELYHDLKALYASHGTRILGWLSTLFSSIQLGLAAMTASPDFKVLVTPKEFMFLFFVNVVLGGLVIKRGHTNANNPQ